MDKLLLLLLTLLSSVVIQIAFTNTTPSNSGGTLSCGNMTCAHHSKCSNASSGPVHCQCHNGYKGETCNEDLDECNLGNPCNHRGICHNTLGSYWCECLSGWNGTEHCDMNLTYVRDCMPGWVGEWCQNQCHDDSGCNPRSYCKQSHRDGSYYCACKTGWSGKNCIDDKNECKSNPCRNSGTCKNTPGSYMCACVNGWAGPDCKEIDTCYTESPCSELSTCSMANHTYHCLCADGWKGVNCTEDVDECKNNQCVHVESCSNSIGSYTCNCTDGWQGDDCNEPINEGSLGSSSVGIIAGTSIAAFLVIVAALLAILYKCKRKRKPSVADMKERNDIANNTFKSQVNGHASKAHQTNT